VRGRLPYFLEVSPGNSVAVNRWCLGHARAGQQLFASLISAAAGSSRTEGRHRHRAGVGLPVPARRAGRSL